MRRLFFLYAGALSCQILLSQNKMLSELRQQYLSSSTGKAAAELFLKSTEGLTDTTTALMIGYKAMGHLMYCDQLSSPYSKLSHFKTGRSILDRALKKDPKQPELVYFRYCTQTKAPAFLSYRENLKSDKEFLLVFLKTYDKRLNPDPQLFAMIKTFLLFASDCTEAEKAILKPL